MHGTPERALDASLLEGRLDRALDAVDAALISQTPTPRVRRLAAGVFAVAGSDRRLAAVAGPALVALKTAADAAAWCLELEDGAESYDLIAAAVSLTWRGDAAGVRGLLERAHALALQEERYHVAAAALERLGHHAMLFGESEVASDAFRAGSALAAQRDLPLWQLRCEARLAELAFATDDLEGAAAIVERAGAAARSADVRWLFAPTAVSLAALHRDEEAVRRWASDDMLALALGGSEAGGALNAAMACICAAETLPLSDRLARALRRGLLLVRNPSNAVDFLALAARCGEPEEARVACVLLRSVFAPERRYLAAHQHLARANVLSHGDDRTAAIDAASDAARAFDGIGMRHWANEAMLLMVHRDDPAVSARRRPTAISLTRREQQVAHLIRRGASNREVAHTLQISEHTVERHVSSILSRLGLRSRWQIVDVSVSSSEH